MSKLSNSAPSFRVAAFYRFAAIADPRALREELRVLTCELDMRGTILVAAEGLNGTVAGAPGAIARLVDHLRNLPDFASLEVKYSEAPHMPFHRMKVRMKREIVTMGVESLDPAGGAGRYVRPADWNALIDDPDTVVIDTRNEYEVALGTFAGSLDPRTASFREFPQWARENAGRLRGRRVAMFCTGGIRCEKATAYMRSLGVKEVFHLEGGILKYLEDVPAEQSRWQGECFVFDERVAVGHGLDIGEARLCRGCRRPLTVEDRLSPLFAEGISCARCHGDRSDTDRERYAERHRQVELAGRRGGTHIGR